MKMKLISIFLFCLSLNAYAQWEAVYGPEGGNVNELDATGEYIFAATNNGLFRTAQAAPIAWEVVQFSNSNQHYEVPKIAVRENVVVAWAKNLVGSPKNFLFKSEDNGETWSELAFPPSMNYFTLLDFNNYGLYIGYRDSVYYSTDNGTSWSTSKFTTLTGSNIFGSAVFNDELYICNSEKIYKSTTDSAWAANPISRVSQQIDIFENVIFLSNFYISGSGLMRSVNGGQTWEYLDNNLYPSSNIIKIGNQFFVSTQDNIVESSDMGEHWNIVPNTSGMNITQLLRTGQEVLSGSWSKGVLVSPADFSSFTPMNAGLFAPFFSSLCPDESGLLVGATGVGILSFDNQTETWSPISLDLTTQYFFDIVKTGDTIFAIANHGKFYRSFDGGQNWDEKFIGSGFNYGRIWFENNILYTDHFTFSSDDFKMSNDFGQTWQKMFINGTEEIHEIEFIGEYSFASSLTKLYRSSDDGQTWELLNMNKLGGFKLLGLTAAKNLLLLQVEIGNRKHLLVSDDLGSNWKLADIGSPYKNSFTYYDATPITGDDDRLYASFIHGFEDQRGIYISIDSAKTWRPFNDNFTAPWAKDIAHDNEYVYVTTPGQGLFRRSMTDADLQTISGRVFIDGNGNGIYEAGESLIPDAILSLTGDPQFTNSGKNGEYLFSSFLAAPDTLKITTPSSPYLEANSSSILVSSPDNNFDFPLNPIPNKKDLIIEATHYGSLVPNDNSIIVLTCRNMGTVPYNGFIGIVMDNYKINFNNASVVPTQINADTIFWIVQIAPYNSIDIKIEITLKGVMTAGDAVKCNVFTNIEQDELTPANNQDSLIIEIPSEEYTGNYETTEPDINVFYEDLLESKPLVYNVYFQNVTNQSIERVKIVDYPSSLLDPTSIQFLSSSHPCTFRLIGDLSAEFTLDVGNLQPSAAGEIGSHGFIKFSILPKKHLPSKVYISNHAMIELGNEDIVSAGVLDTYFVVHTNETSRPTYKNVKIFPNPNNGEFTIQFDSEKAEQVEAFIFDINGKLVSKFICNSNQAKKLTFNNLMGGLYIILGIGENAVWNGRVLVSF